MSYNIAVVENEESMRSALVSLLLQYEKEKDIHLSIKEYGNAYDFLEDESIFDAVLMDIDLPGINGMDACFKLREKNKDVSIIFVTNLPQYAIDGYKVSALDFILKPITYPDLFMAMERINLLKKETEKDSFVLTIKGKTIRFYSNNIEYIEMSNHDVIIHQCDGNNISYRGTLKDIEQVLNPDYFYKCNSGYIVNLYKIIAYRSDTIELESKTQLIVSRSHRKEIINRMNDFLVIQKNR